MGASSIKKGCSYCGLLKALDGGPLFRCRHCGMAAYCGDEHQKFDWKRHKMRCKAVQSKTPPQNPSPLSSQLHSIGPESSSKQCNLNDSISECSFSVEKLPSAPSDTSSIYSLDGAERDSFSSPITPVPIKVPAIAPATRYMKSFGKVVATDYHDVNAIENLSCAHPQKFGRKRSQPLRNRKDLKDHSKNFLFTTSLQNHLRSLTESGIAINQHQAIVLRLKAIAEHVVRSLNEFGWAVVDNFLGLTHCRHVLYEFESLFKRGLFSAGLLMNEEHGWTSEVIRSDQVYWFDGGDERSEDAVTSRLLVSMIDSIVIHFKGHVPYDISGRSRAMVSIYPGNGTRYVKHVDNPGKDGRCITCTYYCNQDWNHAEYGGALRLYPSNSVVPIDVDPQGDRLVFLWSDWRIPHEVMPVFRNRYSLTIWYFDKLEKSELLRRKQEAKNAEHPTLCCGVVSNAVKIVHRPVPTNPSHLLPVNGEGQVRSKEMLKAAFGCEHTEESGFVEMKLNAAAKLRNTRDTTLSRISDECLIDSRLLRLCTDHMNSPFSGTGVASSSSSSTADLVMDDIEEKVLKQTRYHSDYEI